MIIIVLPHNCIVTVTKSVVIGYGAESSLPDPLPFALLINRLVTIARFS